MIFIGATMTLIAHWPGSSSIGENPLKIAGPVLLAVGFVALIVGIFLHCIINNRERRRWQKKMNAVIVASRSYVFVICFFARFKHKITIKTDRNAALTSLLALLLFTTIGDNSNL